MTYQSIVTSHRDETNEYHNDDGPAVTYDDGTQVWLQNGMIHRDNKPAIIWSDGSEAWYQFNMRHREDGPAYIDVAVNTVDWYLNNEIVSSRSEYQKITKISDEDLLVLILKYGGLPCP